LRARRKNQRRRRRSSGERMRVSSVRGREKGCPRLRASRTSGHTQPPRALRVRRPLRLASGRLEARMSSRTRSFSPSRCPLSTSATCWLTTQR